MQEDKNLQTQSVFHIENLKNGWAQGVLEVESFSPRDISLKISAGRMEIHGEALEVKSFDVESGNLTFQGEIFSISLAKTKTSLLKRLTK